MKFATALLLAGALLTVNSRTPAESLPALQVPDTVGVNIHFNRGHERDLDLMMAAGIRVVRMDLGWAGIERKRGEYDWGAYDELTENLLKRGLRPYYILDYSNPLYEQVVTSKNPINGEEQKETASPQHAESIDAFARWAGVAAARFAGRNIIWEIWNEPNISFWKPKPDVQQYIALAKATCRSVRAADPSAILVGPATSEVPVAFLEEFFRSGILENLDAISVHPYRNYRKGPETAEEDYRKIRALVERYAPESKRKIPILSGEWGYASHTKGVSLETQACFLARQQLFNLWQGLPVSIWYDWRNDGEDPTEREQNFGMVSHDLEPKLAYRALQALTAELRGYHVLRRIPLEDDRDYALLFQDAHGRTKLALWTTGDSHDAVIPLPKLSATEVKRAGGYGTVSYLLPNEGKIGVRVEPLPAYIDLVAYKPE